MAQVSERHHHTSQLGSAAVAPPGRQESFPPPAPALHHLNEDETHHEQVPKQSSEQHHHTSQLGAAAVAPPGRQESFPPPAPALHHLNNDDEDTPQVQASEQSLDRHDHSSQLGETAIAPPGGTNGFPPPIPALHHLGEEHNVESKAGSSAIVAPIGEVQHPPPIPAQYHLDDEEYKSSQSPIKPFQHHALASETQSLSSRPAPPTTAPSANPVANQEYQQTQDEDLTFPSLPPFPTNIPIAPLLRINLKKLLNQDSSEIDKVWKASRELGFFYLDLRDAVSTTSSPSINGPSLLQDIDALFSLGEQVFALSVSEKQKYDFIEQGSYYGYKGLGAGVIDKSGTRDRNEFYNISKDDMLGISDPLPAPELLQQQESRDLLAEYVKKSHAIVTLLLGILNSKLGLPENKLQSLHKLRSESGDQVRWVNSPAQPEDDRKKALGEHTDFGTLTLLSNRLGGLQILPPPSSTSPTPTWTYVQPLRSHLIINLGDALVRFSASILRSNIHRVVSPPGAQASHTRMSLVYFSRPEDEVVLRALTGSEVIRRAREVQGGNEEEEVTAKEWILRRALQRRVGGDYGKSEGTEGGRA